MNVAAHQPALHYHVSRPDSHSIVIGYLAWLIGFTGAHRFYYGKPITGAIWFFTAGLLGIGWIVDLVLIPGMDLDANRQYFRGELDYNLAWVLHVFLGVFGVHRFYMGKWISGLVYLFTGGLFLIGWIYDLLTLNDQISAINYNHATHRR